MVVYNILKSLESMDPYGTKSNILVKKHLNF